MRNADATPNAVCDPQNDHLPGIPDPMALYMVYDFGRFIRYSSTSLPCGQARRRQAYRGPKDGCKATSRPDVRIYYTP